MELNIYLYTCIFMLQCLVNQRDNFTLQPAVIYSEVKRMNKIASCLSWGPAGSSSRGGGGGGGSRSSSRVLKFLLNQNQTGCVKKKETAKPKQQSSDSKL